ncbi:MAG: DNA (cytosine-5-)-methyltransferase [Solobacterium sp.]|nr:DNA (cytosine-5-)-methyltransferase [Solobacterium sp.]MCI6877209.1 DNA (cytosine-5-)-methyltransferase [Solobacterium sp.]MDY4792469.1 DNA (cytosine-5-)-methyltransferase [Erysipelotrichaceae bacterium]
MLRVVEAFSGIGAQAKALERIGVPHEIVSTIEWDINAIYAYDLIHNGRQDLTRYNNFTKEDILTELDRVTLSGDGKKAISKRSLHSMSLDTLKRIYCAIERTHNLISITDVKAEELEDGIDLLTYSFPCQDLSICGAWHNNMSGIDRNAHNRSGMLWEVERILKEYVSLEKPLPKFLLMENVSNILSETHRHNFEEWQNYLTSIGYINQIYTLNAVNFGIPQTRERTFMISVLTETEEKRNEVEQYFTNHNLEELQENNGIRMRRLRTFLRLDYRVPRYRIEADISNPNNTPSRRTIYEDNNLLFDGNHMLENTIKTITTKQDRNPNSGIIAYNGGEGKAPYRNLTPRECFLLMGFDERDFQVLVDNNFKLRGKDFFAREKMIKLAGNSIVVNVLEEIFRQIVDIKERIID